jgi:L-asparaginase
MLKQERENENLYEDFLELSLAWKQKVVVFISIRYNSGMKKILILHTGGTISMAEDASGHVQLSSENPLSTPEFSDVTLVTENAFNLPSPQIGVSEMLQLKNRILSALTNENFAGVVITHGTDTLEETAYFLDATLPTDKPVVITGAMRSSNEVGTDGTYNFLSALTVAKTPSSAGRGVLVVMNGEIHLARFVTKTHTTNVSTFQTPTRGPVGLLTKNGPYYFDAPQTFPHHDISSVAGNIPIIKAYAGMSGQIFDLLPTDKLDGLVIEALGAGNLPPAAFTSLKRLLAENIPVVLTSRCFNGLAEPIYAYDGGGVKLHEAGILFAREINAQKARLKLLIGLQAHLNLKKFIEE